MRGFVVSCALGAIALTGCGQGSRSEENTAATMMNVAAWPGCPAEWTTPPDPSWGFPADYGQAPSHFYDFELNGVWFAVPLDGLKTILPSAVKPLEFIPGSGLGLVGASFWNYKDVEFIGPYKESIVSVLVEDPSMFQGYQPLFVVEIAVDSEAAQWAGIQIGLNKILGNTHCRNVRPKGIKCTSESDDTLIMKATIDNTDPQKTFPYALSPTMTLGVRNGLLVHTPVTYGPGLMSANTVPANFKLGEHPLARQLSAAGIGATPSILSIWGEHLSSAVGPGYCTPL
ncbi:MAG TPA: hypothetical protein VLM85_16140 [Polyangiaceae bacterium]|nr:hypothetical protein [Polyangiaceae bacterium]